MNNDIISIIVPTYNCRDYAKECIENIINQTYPYWELILVNGRSTDGTTELCDEYASTYDNIFSIHDIDGLVQARNVGLEKAKGDWILYIDGDDWIDTESLEKLIEASKRHKGVDVVFFNYVQDFYGKSIEKWRWPEKEHEKLYIGDDCRRLAKDCLHLKLGISEAYNKIVRKSLIDKFNLKHNPLLRQGIEGTDYSIRVYFYAKTILYLNEDLYHYRYCETSLAHRIDEKDAYYIAEGLETVKDFIDTNVKDDEKYEFMQALYERSLYALIAKSMGTFFNPLNKNSYRKRKDAFDKFLNTSKVINEALKNSKYTDFNKSRKLVLNAIKNKQYCIIQFVALAKHIAKKIGYFKY